MQLLVINEDLYGQECRVNTPGVLATYRYSVAIHNENVATCAFRYHVVGC